MKTIGLIGGISWVSSLEYYRYMNEIVENKLDGLHSAQILLFSIEFSEFGKEERLAEQGNWTYLKKVMLDAANRLKLGGADFIVICSNTMNSMAKEIEESSHLPVLHIADATAHAIQKLKLRKVALLGTKFTMEQNFYKKILKKHGIEVVTPNSIESDWINRLIFDELCANHFPPTAKQEMIRIIQRLIQQEKVEGVILGCTEIPLLIHEKDLSIPLLNTTKIHSEAAIEYALQ